MSLIQQSFFSDVCATETRDLLRIFRVLTPTIRVAKLYLFVESVCRARLVVGEVIDPSTESRYRQKDLDRSSGCPSNISDLFPYHWQLMGKDMQTYIEIVIRSYGIEVTLE